MTSGLRDAGEVPRFDAEVDVLVVGLGAAGAAVKGRSKPSLSVEIDAKLTRPFARGLTVGASANLARELAAVEKIDEDAAALKLEELLTAA